MSRSITVDSDTEAKEFFELMQSRLGDSIDPLITFDRYVRRIGDRFLRGVDLTSTAAGYRAGLRLRVLPALGHLRVRGITAGVVDRAIDSWETTHSRSTLKNTIAALTRVLDEAVRDDLITRNPVRDRADRRYRSKMEKQHVKPIPAPGDVERIAEACAAIHQSYGDHIMLSAFLAARSSEVAGFIVGDVDWTNRIVTIERQCFPGIGGLSIKPPKGRRVRRVPILSRWSRYCADSRCGGNAACRCCAGHAAASSQLQHCAMQPVGTSWLHRWGYRGCDVTTFGMRAQPGSQTQVSRSTS